MNIETMKSTYQSLLADVSRKLEIVKLTLPDDVDLSDWVLKKGPELDKKCIRLFGDTEPRFFGPVMALGLLEFRGDVPEWLRPLWDVLYLAIVRRDTNEAVKIFRGLRTLLVFCYKIEHAPTKLQLEEAQKAFLEAEDGIRIWDSTFDSANPGPYYRYVRSLIQRVLCKGTREDLVERILPSHGPGAVYPARKPGVKSRFTTIYPSIQEFYPFDRWFWSLFTEDLASSQVQNFLVEREDRTIMCNLIAVPKDSRGPRLICVHPAEAIWIQQGQRRWLEGLISSSKLTQGKISFNDQSKNGERALISSSRIGGFVTLDLKEASDRISLKLFEYLFAGYEDILKCARATHVQLLDKRIVELRKFAPMGNCLTFPVESLLFWALCTAAIHIDGKDRTSDSLVYVFGDDIEYHPQFHRVVLERLVSAGLVPNASKTFVTGSFKESCGVDAFMGFDVTPLRLRSLNPSSVSGAVALCDLARRARDREYYRLSNRLYDLVREHWFVGITNNPNATGLVEYLKVSTWELEDYVAQKNHLRYNRKWDRWETKCLLPKVVIERPSHTRWCVVDSLWKLTREYGDWVPHDEMRRYKGDELDKAVRKYKQNLLPCYNEGGLVYADPDRIRLQPGWTPTA